MGLDLGKYSVEELENDEDFMIDVLEYSQDKNMYKLCSNSLKTKSKMMQYMFDKYGDDEEFIKENVIDAFHKDGPGDIDSLIVTFDYEHKHNIDDSIVREDLAILTDEELKYLDNILEKYKDNVDVMSVLQNGFAIIQDEFENYETKKIILDYFAKVFIREALSLELKNGKRDLNVALEEASKKEYFNMNRFIIEYISDYDTNLGEYASKNLGVINPIRESIRNFIINKPMYDKQVELETFQMIDEEIREYMEDDENRIGCPETFILYYIGGELGITDLIHEYESIELDKDDEFIFMNIYQDELEENNGLHHKKLKNIMERCIEETGYIPTHKAPEGYEELVTFGKGNNIELSQPKDFIL